MIEVLVSVFLFAAILMGIYGVLLTGDIIYNKDTLLLNMEAQSRQAVDRIARDVRQASSQTITQNYNSTTNDKIMFTIPTAAGIQYYLNGNNLIREYPAGTRIVFATNIDLLKFTLTGSLLQVQLEANQSLYGQPVVFPLVQRVRLRNE